jgi:hypothetical protein
MIFGILLFSALIMSPTFGVTGKVIKTLREDKLLNVMVKTDDQLETHGGELLIELHPALQVILLPESRIKLGRDQIFLEKGALIYKAFGAKTHYAVSLEMIKFSPKSSNAEFEVSKKSKNEVIMNVKMGEVEAASPLVMTFVPEIIKEKKGFAFSADKRTFEQREFNLRNNSKLEFMRKQD